MDAIGFFNLQTSAFENNQWLNWERQGIKGNKREQNGTIVKQNVPKINVSLHLL
jgi:hypothetical protein